MIRLLLLLLSVLKGMESRYCTIRDFSHFGIVNFTHSVGSHQVFAVSIENLNVAFTLCGDIREKIPSGCKPEDLVYPGFDWRLERQPLLIAEKKGKEPSCQAYFRSDMVYSSSDLNSGNQFCMEPKNPEDKFICLTILRPNYSIGEFDGQSFLKEEKDVVRVGLYLIDYEFEFLDYFKTDLNGHNNWLEITFNVMLITLLCGVFTFTSTDTLIGPIKPFQFMVNWSCLYLVMFTLLETARILDSPAINSLLLYLVPLGVSILDLIIKDKIFIVTSRLFPVLCLGWVYNTMFWDSMFYFWHILIIFPILTFLAVACLAYWKPEITLEVSLGPFIGYRLVAHLIAPNMITPYGIWVYNHLNRKTGNLYLGISYYYHSITLGVALAILLARYKLKSCFTAKSVEGLSSEALLPASSFISAPQNTPTQADA